MEGATVHQGKVYVKLLVFIVFRNISDGRPVQVRACGLCSRGFAKRGGETCCGYVGVNSLS